MDIETLVSQSPDAGRRVFAIEVDGRRCWVKRATKNYPNWAARLLGGLARGIASAGVDHEIAGLSALRRRGFITPDVVFSNAEYLVLSDIGPTLFKLMVQADGRERERVASAAAGILRRLHDVGGWHGAARLYNMTQCGDQIGFIDLENTVGFWMPLPMRRLWDLWQLCNSIAFFDDSGAITASALRAYGNSPAVRAMWGLAVFLVGAYLLLKPFRHLVKRELRQAIVCVSGIYQAGRNPAPR